MGVLPAGLLGRLTWVRTSGCVYLGLWHKGFSSILSHVLLNAAIIKLKVISCARNASTPEYKFTSQEYKSAVQALD